jgi:hypothetical protein
MVSLCLTAPTSLSASPTALFVWIARIARATTELQVSWTLRTLHASHTACYTSTTTCAPHRLLSSGYTELLHCYRSARNMAPGDLPRILQSKVCSGFRRHHYLSRRFYNDDVPHRKMLDQEQHWLQAGRVCFRQRLVTIRKSNDSTVLASPLLVDFEEKLEQRQFNCRHTALLVDESMPSSPDVQAWHYCATMGKQKSM